MKKRLATLALAAVLALALVSPALTAGSTSPGIFSPQETKAALAGSGFATAPDRLLTYPEGVSLLVSTMGWTFRHQALDFDLDTACLTPTINLQDKTFTLISTPDSRSAPMTLRQFIDTQAKMAYRSYETPQYLYIDAEAVTSPLLGTSFLSPGEADALTEVIDQPLTAGTAAVLCTRQQELYTLNTHVEIDFEPLGLFSALLPEYADILDVVGPDALDYWTDAASPYATWTLAVHEMVHEYVALTQGVFDRREKTVDETGRFRWGTVYWSETPMVYFTGSSLLTASRLSLPPMSIIYDAVPQAWKDDLTYISYLEGHEGYTIYEALQEYTAAAAQLTADIRLAALSGTPALHTSEHKQYAAWDYYVQLYLLTLKEQRPDAWAGLLADGTIPRIICETSAFVQHQTSLEHAISYYTDLSDEMRAKMDTAPFQTLRAELTTAASGASNE